MYAAASCAVEEARFLKEEEVMLHITSDPQDHVERVVRSMLVVRMLPNGETFMEFVQRTCAEWGPHCCPLRTATGLVLSEVTLMQKGDRHEIAFPTLEMVPADAEEPEARVYFMLMKGERIGLQALEPSTDGAGRRRTLDPRDTQVYAGETANCKERHTQHEAAFTCPDGCTMRAGALARATGTHNSARRLAPSSYYALRS